MVPIPKYVKLGDTRDCVLTITTPQNPLHFSFPPDVDEEALMSGAEQLSQAIMESGMFARRFWCIL